MASQSQCTAGRMKSPPENRRECGNDCSGSAGRDLIRRGLEQQVALDHGLGHVEQLAAAAL